VCGCVCGCFGYGVWGVDVGVGVGVVVSHDILGECVGVGECGIWCRT